MPAGADEDALLHSVAIQNATAILIARRRAEEELVATKEALRHSAERLELALAASHLGDWSWEASTDLVTLGPRAAEIFGLAPQTPITWTRIRDLLHQDDRERARIAVERSLTERSDYDTEYRVTHSSGEPRWIAAKGRGTYAEDGSVLGMIGVVQDITERKHVEETLRENEERLRATFNQAAVGIAIAQLDGRFLELNTKFSDVLGYSEDELRQLTFVDITHPDDLPQTQVNVQRLLAGEVAAFTLEKRYVRKDGATLWSSTTVTTLKEKDGRPSRFIGVIEDISQRKQLLESERSARAEAERMSAMKDEFLATLSHELRTPLSAILGWSLVLQRHPMAGGELQKALETIERNARLQAQLIDDLLDMSRITSGKVRLDVQPVEPVSFVESAIETVKPAADAKGIRLQKLLDPSAGPISGDPARLQQVVWNLLSNAIKFTEKEGKVQVTLQRVNSHIEITVADTGVGIGPEFLSHVFERFRQADPSSTRRHGGLGLGLSIVKNLVELHGGTVQAFSPGEGLGTTFTVTLPLTVIHRAASAGERVHPRAVSAVTSDYPLADLSGLKVLVVDDEGDARDLVRKVLSDCGAEVINAGSASEALALVQKELPQLMVTDIGMPEMDGYELLQCIRALDHAKGGNTPAIALTAFARSADRTRALREGFLVHVSKPVEPSELIATVASVARRSRTS